MKQGCPLFPALTSPQGDLQRLWGAVQLPLRHTHNPEGQPWKGVVVEPLTGQVGLSFKPQPQPPPRPAAVHRRCQHTAHKVPACQQHCAQTWAWLTRRVIAGKRTPHSGSNPLPCKRNMIVPPSPHAASQDCSDIKVLSEKSML